MARREYFRVTRRTRIIWFAPAAANLVVNVDVAGSITWAGATNITLVQTTSIPRFTRRRKRKPKRIVRGSRIQRFTAAAPLVVNVDVPGQVTWTGATNITLVQTFSAPIVKRRLHRKPKRIVRGSRIARFTPLVAGVSNVDTPGQIIWTGQTVVLAQTNVVTAGAITWTGQSVPLQTKIIPTAGLVTWSGATDITLVQTTSLPYFTKRQPRRPKRIVRGSRLAKFTALVPGVSNVDTPGQITWTGQALPLKFTLVAPTSGAITWSGQTVTLQIGTTPTAGSITWSGQTIPLKYVVVITAGQITWSGSTVTVIDSGSGIGFPVEYALATDTSAYAVDRDSTSEAKVLETVGASGSRDTFGEAKAVDTT